MSILIKNINDKSDNKCNCGSWIDHWNKYSTRPILFCSELKCTRRYGLVGAHVQRAGNDDWHIIPLCREHNATGGELEVCDNTEFVSANVGEDCG